MLVSVIVPCYNEEKVIEKTYSEISRILGGDSLVNHYDYELVFVDDGSKDQTAEILERLCASDFHGKYITFSRNFGKEAAMYAGLQYSRGDCVVIMDADLRHPPELIPKMYKYFLEGYDQVIGKRNRKGDTKRKTYTARLYYRLVNHMVDVRMDDGVGDFRLLSRKAVNALLSMTEYNRFSKGLFSWIGFKQKIINYENRERAGGETKWSLKRLLQYGIDGLMSFNNKPLRICFFLGGILVGISVLYLLVIFVQILIRGVDMPGYFTTILAISIIGGAQLIFIGVLGEYVGRIYYEVKHRPHYLVDKTNTTRYENKDGERDEDGRRS